MIQFFQRFKEVVGPENLTPLEMWLECGKNNISLSNLRAISIVFPFADKIRQEGYKNQIILAHMKLPVEIYSLARNYANEFKVYIMNQIINFFQNQGFNAVAGMLSKNFTLIIKGRFYSIWFA